jgi:polyhydroxyalkanoate synthesis regulator phasin
MKIYLDSLDTYYSIKHEAKLKPKPKKDYAGIGAIIFTFTVMSIVIALSIYTAWQIAYGIEDNNDVKENNVINELVKTGKFTKDEAKKFASMTMQDEQKGNNSRTDEQKGNNSRTDEQENKNNNQTDSKLLSGIPGGDTINVDTKLWRYDTLSKPAEYESFSAFPVNRLLDVSSSSIVCPSNQCKITEDEMIFKTDDNDGSMQLYGDFNIVDDKSNGNFGPKKQNLIEKMSISFGCHYQDIQEDPVKKTTKYICSEPNNNYAFMTRSFNNTLYPYTFTATFELPSRHLVLNATEAHDDPFLFSSGHVVFKDEDGKIVVK